MVAAHPALAQIAHPININNPSFEAPVAPSNPGYTTDVITNWSGSSNSQGPTESYGVSSQAADPALYPGGIPDGAQFAYANNSIIFQDVSAALTAGATYTLTAYVGYRADFGGSGSVDLYASDGTFLKGRGTVTAPQGTFTPVTVSLGPGESALVSNLGKGLRIVLSNDIASGQVDFAKVRLTEATPAPEPSQFAALALGASGPSALTLRARRRA